MTQPSAGDGALRSPRRQGVRGVIRVVPFDEAGAEPIVSFESRLASAVHLGNGRGEAHAYAVHVQPGGEIGEHVTGFGQLFVVVQGRGWVRAEGEEVVVQAGEAAVLPRGVVHAKGSETGLTAIMIQIRDLDDG